MTVQLKIHIAKTTLWQWTLTRWIWNGLIRLNKRLLTVRWTYRHHSSRRQTPFWVIIIAHRSFQSQAQLWSSSRDRSRRKVDKVQIWPQNSLFRSQSWIKPRSASKYQTRCPLFAKWTSNLLPLLRPLLQEMRFIYKHKHNRLQSKRPSDRWHITNRNKWKEYNCQRSTLTPPIDS